MPKHYALSLFEERRHLCKTFASEGGVQVPFSEDAVIEEVGEIQPLQLLPGQPIAN